MADDDFPDHAFTEAEQQEYERAQRLATEKQENNDNAWEGLGHGVYRREDRRTSELGSTTSCFIYLYNGNDLELDCDG